jgi:hypothetical protein
MTQEQTWKPVNENGDFIDHNCLFVVNDIVYEYSGVVHDDDQVYGYGFDIPTKEQCFKFSEVTARYKLIK